MRTCSSHWWEYNCRLFQYYWSCFFATRYLWYMRPWSEWIYFYDLNDLLLHFIATKTDNLINVKHLEVQFYSSFHESSLFFLLPSFLFVVIATGTPSRATTLDTLYNPVPFAILNVPGPGLVWWCSLAEGWHRSDIQPPLRCRGQLPGRRCSSSSGPGHCCHWSHLAPLICWPSCLCYVWATSQSQSQRVPRQHILQIYLTLRETFSKAFNFEQDTVFES